MFKDTEEKTLMFREKGLFIKCSCMVGQVEDIVDIVTVSRSYKVMMSGVPEAILLEGVVVRNATFYTLEKVIDGRGGNQ